MSVFLLSQLTLSPHAALAHEYTQLVEFIILIDFTQKNVTYCFH